MAESEANMTENHSVSQEGLQSEPVQENSVPDQQPAQTADLPIDNHIVGPEQSQDDTVMTETGVCL